MKNSTFLIIVFLFLSKINYAQPGELDSSFGKNGIVKSDLGARFEYTSIPKQVLEAPDGTLFTLREQEDQTYISKRDKNGKIDMDYGTDGFSRAINLREGHAVLLPDGKIVIAGSNSVNNRRDFVVSRFDTSGGLDYSFSGDGRQTTKFETAAYATAVAMQNDGKIILAGYTTTVDDMGNSNFDFALARYKTNGSLDSGFSDDGKLVMTDTYTDDVPTAIAIQSDGKIVVVGSSTNNAPNEHYSFSTMVRFNINGSIDTDFSADNEKFGFLFASPNAVAIQDDGKIVVAGQSIISISEDNTITSTDIFVARYNASGSIDKTFNSKGWETSDFGYNSEDAFAVAIHVNGKIVVGCNIWNGNNNDFALARFNANGGLDSSFSSNGLKRIDFDYGEEKATLLSVHNSGLIVMAGSSNYTNLGITHIKSDGSFDNTYNGNGKLAMPFFSNSQGSTNFASTAVQSDGKIVTGGNTWNGSNTDFLLVRYNINGTVDSSFNEKGWQTTDLSVYVDDISSIAIQKDDKIVAGGHTSDQSGIRFALSRYNTNGILDSTFSGDGIQNNNLSWFGQINSIAIQTDGKIVAAGNIWNGSNNDVGVARYNINGSLDSTFGNNGIVTTDLGNSEDIGKSVTIQNNGKIVVSGSIYNYANTDFVIFRYNANGTLDATFNSDGIVIVDLGGNDDCSGIALQSDGKIVAVGSTYQFEDYDYLNTDIVTARFNTDGTADNTYGNSGVVITDLGNNDNGSAIAIEKNGKIVVGGGSNSRFAFVRYNTNGSLDTTFSQNGSSTVSSSGSASIENSVQGIAIAGNRLYAAGNGKYPGNLGVMVRYKLDEGTARPIVSIITPADSAIYAAPAVVKISATASDPDGTVTKVQFYNGAKLLYTKTVAPYTYNWKNVPAGNYAITAKATDNNDMVTVSDTVKISVVDHYAPTVYLINPVDNDRFAGPTTIRMRASAVDPEGTISKVEFYNDKTLLRVETVYPYTYTWKDIPAGKYTLTAKATSSFGLVTTSAAVHITVVANKAPAVIITSIANGQDFTSLSTIPLVAAAKDPDGTIQKVQFYNGTTLLSTQYASPYAYNWKGVPSGTYKITAKAIDNLGLTATSAAIQITVSNSSIVSARASLADKLADLNVGVSMKAWPNPANNSINIYTKGLQQNVPATISVISAFGVVMKTIQITNANQTVQLDISSLVSGVYTIKVLAHNQVVFKKFTKM